MKRILSKGRRSFQKKAETPRATETKAPADTYDDGIEDDSLYTDHPSIKNPYTHNGDDDDDDGGDNSHFRKVYEEVEQYYADTTNPVAKTRPSSAGKGGSGGNYPSYRSPVSTMTGTPTGTTTPAAGTTKADRAQQTRDLVKKFIADIWNRGELDLIPEVCSPSLRFNGNTGFDRVGHDGLARMVATLREALDDYHCEIHSMVVEDNKAFCRLRFTGKHTGNLLGYAPTHNKVAWMGATEFTCQNGKILKVWELGDVKSLEDQLNKKNQHDDDDDASSV